MDGGSDAARKAAALTKPYLHTREIAVPASTSPA